MGSALDRTFEFRAILRDVIDGDTYRFSVDLGFNIQFEDKFRLYQYNTPETYGVLKSSEEYQRGVAATQFAEMFIQSQQDEKGWVRIRTYKTRADELRRGKYGRWLVDVLPQSNSEDSYALGESLYRVGLAEKIDY